MWMVLVSLMEPQDNTSIWTLILLYTSSEDHLCRCGGVNSGGIAPPNLVGDGEMGNNIYLEGMQCQSSVGWGWVWASEHMLLLQHPSHGSTSSCHNPPLTTLR